jgi:hypothetical protein
MGQGGLTSCRPISNPASCAQDQRVFRKALTRLEHGHHSPMTAQMKPMNTKKPPNRPITEPVVEAPTSDGVRDLQWT